MPPPSWTIIFTVTAIVYLGMGIGVPWFYQYQVAQHVYMMPADAPQQDVPAQAATAPAIQDRSTCPVTRYLDRHYCEGPSTARNALNCALRRLRRWERQSNRLAGPVPSLVTVFTGPANYEEIVEPDNLRHYCETDVRQTVWQCNTITNSAGRPPSCRKLPTKCFVRHSLPEGHFQFPQDLDCEGGPPS